MGHGDTTGGGPATSSDASHLLLGRRAVLAAAVGGIAAVALPRSAGAAGIAARSVPLWPPIVPRTEWATAACRPTGAPDVGPPVRRVVVHHTAIFPRLAPGDAPDAIRQMCINHIRDRHFSDIAYHLLIDRFGVIYQGRAGSILAPVVGAHAQGFNEGTVGVALIGDHDADPVPEPARVSLVRTIAWLSQLHGFDPGVVTPHTSTGGPRSLVAEGRSVALPGIMPHRRVAPTQCPGTHLTRYVASGRLLQHVEAELTRRPAAVVPSPEPAVTPSPEPAVTPSREPAGGQSARGADAPGPERSAPAPVQRAIDRIVDRFAPRRRRP